VGSVKRLLQECVSAVQGYPRSLILVPIKSTFATVCDFLLVRHSNFGLYLAPFQRYCRFFLLMTPPLFHPILGVFPRDQIAKLGSIWAGTLP